MALQHLRSSTANKRPVPGNMSDGQLGINTNTASPGLFFKDSNNTLVKVGPVHVGTTAPNASPASGGTAGNSVGEQWLDTTGGTYVFKVWDGSAWRSETGTFVDVNGDVMTGALGIIAGSAGAPGLYISGDTNTGVFSPGSDQLALATGGTGRVFVDASGNVSISGEALSVNGVGIGRGGGNVSTNTRVGDSALTSNTTGAFNTAVGVLALTSNTTGTSNTSIGRGSQYFNTSGSSNVAVGRDALQANLSGSLNVCIGADAGKNIDGSSNTIIGSIPGTSGLSNTVIIGAGTTERMRITSAGNVGIGTSAPGNLLELKQESPAFRQTSVSESGGYVATFGLNYSSTDTVVIEGNPTGQAPTRIFRWGAGGNLTLNYASTAASRAFIVTDGATERARIDSSGRLLVGTSSSLPNSNEDTVQIAGTGGTNIGLSRFAATFAGPEVSFYKSRNATVGNHTVVQTDDILGNFYFYGSSGSSSYVEGARISALVEAGTKSTTSMPSRLVFSTTSDGQASPTPRLTITSTGQVRLAGAGITFNGDTATANELDDYEEGTFTPTIVGTSTAGTATYGANGQQGRYTKIGNRVFFDLYLAWSAHTGTGDLQINGLPFTVQNTTNLNRTYSTIFSSLTLTAGSIGAAFSSPNTTTIALRQLPTGGGSVATVPMDTSAQISISGSFDV